MRPRGIPGWAAAVVVLLAIGWYLAGGSIDFQSNSDAPAEVTAATADSRRFSDLDSVDVDDLPAEAATTLDLIAAGGPFPFSRDGAVFQNRERLLPLHDLGHYQEFTVVTPGESDRGARRIVAGADGGLYYTDDHYSSFREIVQSAS